MSTYKTIAESNNFIVLDNFKKFSEWNEAPSGYQDEASLERELIEDLVNQGYEYLSDLTTPGVMLANVRLQLQNLNKVQFTDSEWERFKSEYLDRPSENLTDKTRKIHDDYIYDFVFDDARIQNVYLVDKKDITNNKLHVISQFEQTGSHENRYYVTIMVKGLLMVHIEFTKCGVAIQQAFNQVHRYTKESFNSE